MDGRYAFSPYCGAPPEVGALWDRWNLDPALIGALGAGLVAWAAYERLAGRSSARRRGAFLLGWLITALVLISPLCALSVSLFSARVSQHMILATLAAPLLALGLPARGAGRTTDPLLAALGFTLALWFWHTPAAYLLTFQSDAAYWTMHVTSLGAAFMFWRASFRARGEQLGVGVAATLMAGLQMALLGAIITFLPGAVYAPHALTTAAWGLTPLQDQQLGGAIMWVPAGVIFAGAILAPLGKILHRRPSRPSLAMGS